MASARNERELWDHDIKLERRLENEAVETASVKGNVRQVAMDLQEGASVYDYGMPAMC